jgi:peroxiredoxin
MKKAFFLAVLFAAPFLVFAQNQPSGLLVNALAPDFSAKDQQGKPFQLSSALKKGSVVVVFYRGQWCPYCNKQLKAIQDSLSMIIEKGATMVAVSPEKADNIAKTIEKTKVSFPVLQDDGMNIMNQYQVRFAVDTATVSRYKKFGVDFADVNGTNGANLPVPAVYIINSKGEIVFRHFDTDYRKRVSVKEILLHL